MNFSLRELFLIVAFISLVVGGVRTGPPVSWISLSILVCLVFSQMIDVCVKTGTRRNFAIGFCIVAGVYLLLCAKLGESEFYAYNPGVAKLPTSRIIDACLQPSFPQGTSTQPDAIMVRGENAKSVFPLGHLAAACILGYLGGCYARLATRQVAKPSKNENRIDS